MYSLEGLFTEFTWGQTVPSPAQEYGLLSAFHLLDPCGRCTIDFMRQRRGPKWSLSIWNVKVGPILYNIELTVAATEIETLENRHY